MMRRSDPMFNLDPHNIELTLSHTSLPPQFALNLEYLEGNFYSCATHGKPLDKGLWGGEDARTLVARVHAALGGRLDDAGGTVVHHLHLPRTDYAACVCDAVM